MGGGYAWVTLATNDSYSLGALVLAHSLKQVGTQQQLAVLITPGVTDPMRTKLSEIFNVVKEVNILDSKDEENLKLLKRPELGITFTKLHCWRLTQFEKCVFLDADTLVLENCDELFEREEFSAAPDIGWPDCFNSGVYVYRPSNDTYEKLIQFALEKGSFDGGDQGLLNLYFSDWAHKDISKHLPFIYNMSSTACYSYLPAFKQFGKNAKIIHFIGSSKPWLQYFNTETRKVHPSEGLTHLDQILQLWWNIFCDLIHPKLSPNMAGLAGAFASLTLGQARTPEQQALDDHLRRQGWEVGNIDYLGKDSFENIWSKICETLSGGEKESSPPKTEEKPAEPAAAAPEPIAATPITVEPVQAAPAEPTVESAAAPAAQKEEPAKVPEPAPESSAPVSEQQTPVAQPEAAVPETPKSSDPIVPQVPSESPKPDVASEKITDSAKPEIPTPSVPAPVTQTPAPETQTPAPETQTPAPASQTPTPATQTPVPESLAVAETPSSPTEPAPAVASSAAPVAVTPTSPTPAPTTEASSTEPPKTEATQPPKATETPKESPQTAPTEAPKEVPPEVPKTPSTEPKEVIPTLPVAPVKVSEVPPTQTPAAPADVPKEVPQTAPADVPKTTPADIPKTAPVEIPKDAPKTASTDPSKDVPQSPVVASKESPPALKETPAQTPADTPKAPKQAEETAQPPTAKITEPTPPATPSTPTTPKTPEAAPTPQPKALGVDTSAPETPPPATPEAATGPTPPPRKGSGTPKKSGGKKK